jgi:hemolysin III
VTFPAALAAGVVLSALAPAGSARAACIVYTATSSLLFGISAAYHRGRWRESTRGVLKRLDHANVYLMIAGTYTPVAVLALRGDARMAVLVIVWTGAAVGVAFRLLWVEAPRWLYTPLYLVLGWVAAFFVPQLIRGAGPAAFGLILSGGLLYTLGGLAYGLRWPDPSPRWFGFHEVFHALTVAAYAAQYVAVSMIAYDLARPAGAA